MPINVADYENAWHLITAVYDGGHKRIYRDGVEIGSTEVTGAVGTSGTMVATV